MPYRSSAPSSVYSKTIIPWHFLSEKETFLFCHLTFVFDWIHVDFCKLIGIERTVLTEYSILQLKTFLIIKTCPMYKKHSAK